MTADFSILKGRISDEELAALVAVVNSVASEHAKQESTREGWSNVAQAMRHAQDATTASWHQSTLPR